MRALIAILTLSLVAGGCSSYRPIRVTLPASDSSGVVQGIRIDDTVKLQLRNGSDVKLRVARVLPDTVVGTHGERVPAADIVSVERLAANPGKTVPAVVRIVVTLASAIAAVAAIAMVASSSCYVCY